MVGDDGRVVLMDFGTGRERDDPSSSDLTGTPLYVAPEVLGGRSATAQSDVYSLGVLLFHVLTGSYPVLGKNLAEIRAAHGAGSRAKPSRHPPRRTRLRSHVSSSAPSTRYPNGVINAPLRSALLFGTPHVESRAAD
jgi:serine/threonine protein kinase